MRPGPVGPGKAMSSRTIPGILVLLLICSSLAGCLWPEVPEPPEVGLEVESFGAYSVVAPIDTGINVAFNFSFFEITITSACFMS